MTAVPTRVDVFVDPSCPFAWITYRWLSEVEQVRPIELRVGQISLSVVNEDRVLDEWYRGFNDAAWGPARVMNAVRAARGDQAARQFYEAFGERFHVREGTSDDADRDALASEAVGVLGLPGELAATLSGAAGERGGDDALRAITAAALDPVGLDVGVPVVVIDGVAASGPVLSEIPRGSEAGALFDAVRVLAAQPGFVRYERARRGALRTA